MQAGSSITSDFGIASTIQGSIPRDGVIAVKAIAKVAVPAAIGLTGVEVYKDIKKYDGWEAAGAAGISIAGTLTAGVAGALLATAYFCEIRIGK